VRSLHIRLLVRDANREDVVALTATLRAAGHMVTVTDASAATDTAPADFVLTDGPGGEAPASLAAAEARLIAATLRHTGGNRRQAALLLGIARSTLLAKIRKHGLD
jgi:two-component system NtrC family response regulator